jgi:tripartite ATP-independent transporter DctM subunit
VVLAGALMAGVSGSGTADAAALGSTMIPALERQGYDKRFAAAVTAFSGALGPIIPPSIFLIIYGAMGNVSIGQLFMAGIVPGLLMVVALMVTIHIFVVRRGYGATLTKTTFMQKLVALRVAAVDLVLPIGIIGGIRFGVFTPTEAGAVAVAYVLLTGAFVHRTLGWSKILKASRETISVLGSVMLLIAMAAIIQYVLALYQASDHLGRLMTGLSTSPLAFLLITNAVLLVLGSLMEATAVLILMTPILVPLLPKFGIDPVHYGMVLCMNMTLGLLTPPVGLAMFVTCAIARISVEQFFRAAWPFFAALILLLLAMILFPWISLWIPHSMVR